MLDWGEDGNSILREAWGDAAGDSGGAGPTGDLGTGIGNVVVSVKSGCTLPDRRGEEAKSAPLTLRFNCSSSLSDSTVGC